MDIISLKAYENDFSAQLPEWQKEALDEELDKIECDEDQLISWEELKNRLIS